MTTSNQKAQHPIAPPVAETVPQWCRALFAELCGRGYFNYQHKEESITGKEIIAIICKHSPNAQPMQAVNDDVKAVFATVKEQAYKLPNKCECSGSEPCVTCELLARIDDLERSLELARHAPKEVPQQGVPEIPPASEPYSQARRWWQSLPFGEQMVQHYNAPPNSTIEAMYEIHMKRSRATSQADAEGNALPIQDRVTAIRTRAEAAEAKCAELEKEIESVRSQYLPHASLTIACQDYEAKLAAANEKCENARRTIAELTNSVVAATERAEAAEAEVARLHKIVGDCELVAFDNCNPPQLWSWIGDWEGGAAEPLQRIKNAKDAVKEIADLTAQLAAANERIREAYAILCQLDNVYRRQSTESVGSFSVTQEVHSLLKRAMDTLNGKGRK